MRISARCSQDLHECQLPFPAPLNLNDRMVFLLMRHPSGTGETVRKPADVSGMDEGGNRMTDRSVKSSSEGDIRALLRFGWIAFAVSVFALLVGLDLRDLFNADVCYVPMLVKDIASMGGRFSEWDVPPAPYLFPDFVVYVVWQAIFRNPAVSLVLSGVTFLVLFVAGWVLVARRVGGAGWCGAAGQCVVLAGGSALCTFAGLEKAALSSVAITAHSGVAAMVPYVILLTLALLDVTSGPPPKMRRMVVLGGVIAFLVMSDMISIVQVCVPVAACAAVMMLKAGTARRRGWMVVIILAVGTILGLMMLGRIDRTASVAYLQPVFSPGYASAAAGHAVGWIADSFREQPGWALVAVASGCGLVAVVVAGVLRGLRGGGMSADAMVVPVFAVVVFAGTVLGVLVAGRWMPVYMYPAVLTIVFAAMVMLSRLRLIAAVEQRGPFFLVALFAVTVALNCGYLSRASEIVKYADGAPAWVKILDERTGRLGLKCGVTDYWLAKPAMLFSSRNVKMIQSTTGLMPYDWISNRNWYDRFAPDFVLCASNGSAGDRIREQDVVSRFGAPSVREDIGGLVLLGYPGENGKFAGWWRNHPMRVRFGSAGERAVYEVRDLAGEPVRIQAPEWPAGSSAFGVRRTLPMGEYSIRVRYEGTMDEKNTPPGAWEAMRVAKDKGRPIGGGMLSGVTNVVDGSFVVGGDSQVDIRILFSGGGSLIVQAIELERRR